MDIVRQDGILVIKPRGQVCEYNLTAYSELLKLMEEVARANAGPELAVIADLSDVTFMNSTGLSQLVQIYIGTHNRGGRFVLCGVPARVKLLLKITRLDLVLTSFDTLLEALQALVK